MRSYRLDVVFFIIYFRKSGIFLMTFTFTHMWFFTSDDLYHQCTHLCTLKKTTIKIGGFSID